MNVVVFDADEFLSLYPQFQNVFTPEQLGIFFNAACLLLDNTENSKVTDLTERKTLLYMLVCHIATLQQRGTGMVGLLTSATEGKVPSAYRRILIILIGIVRPTVAVCFGLPQRSIGWA